MTGVLEEELMITEVLVVTLLDCDIPDVDTVKDKTCISLQQRIFNSQF